MALADGSVDIPETFIDKYWINQPGDIPAWRYQRQLIPSYIIYQAMQIFTIEKCIALKTCRHG